MTRAPQRRSRRRSSVALEQLGLALDSGAPRWSFSRLVSGSPHFARIRERIELVRGFFPEMNGWTIRVGLVKKRGVLGWGSLDPERPGIWIRPRRLELFTIGHEMTHLLQARDMVPRGERQCDLWTLARSPLLIDSLPSYLKMPRTHQREVGSDLAAALHRLARAALEARAAGERAYLKRFEREAAGLRPPGPGHFLMRLFGSKEVASA